MVLTGDFSTLPNHDEIPPGLAGDRGTRTVQGITPNDEFVTSGGSVTEKTTPAQSSGFLQSRGPLPGDGEVPTVIDTVGREPMPSSVFGLVDPPCAVKLRLARRAGKIVDPPRRAGV